jgi:hypothetical protein
MLAQHVEQASITQSPVAMPRLTTIIFIVTLIAVSAAVMPLRAQSDSPCNQGRAIAPAVDPRNEHAECFPELGRTEGTITDCAVTFGGETYGRNIWSVGDINNDGLQDWIVARQRCDTVVADRYPIELLLYKGEQGGLPSVEGGERIGPSEVGSITKLLASGDWDGDGHQDIAVRVQILGDTSAGNKDANYDISTNVIFWGNSHGKFSINDTTHLSCGTQMWGGPLGGLSYDFDGDKEEDLMIWVGGAGFSAGHFIGLPELALYKGHRNRRWGRDGVPNIYDWFMWNRPPLTALAVMDQDSDGVGDIIFYSNTSVGAGAVGILYGKRGGLPDTTEVENIHLDSANGHYSLFSDVTGDGIPELLMTCGSQDQIKVFIGLKGQRLNQQYGSGNQPPHPDSTQWWGRPWATVWMPRKVNPNWFGDYHELYDLGDGNLDGIDDIWCFSWPYLLCYSGGVMLDSLVDGLVRVPLSGVISAARLGDIDGSGVATMAVSYDGSHSAQHAFPGGIIYIKPSRSIPRDGTPRRLPDGTGPSGSEVPVEQIPKGEALRLSRTDIP